MNQLIFQTAPHTRPRERYARPMRCNDVASELRRTLLHVDFIANLSVSVKMIRCVDAAM